MSTTPFPLGVYLSNPNGDNETTFNTEYQNFVATMDATPQFIDTYVDQTQPISSWVSNASYQAWSNAQSPDSVGLTPVIALPFTSTAAGALTPDQYFQAWASGAYDSVLQGMVKAWASYGATTQYWRPGWEMNLPSMPSYAGTSAATQADWIAAFQHIYTVLHAAGAADGVNIQVVWNPSIINYDNVEATTQLYPGNAYVDVIGADVYSNLYPYGAPNAIYDWAANGEVLNAPNPVIDTSLQQWASNPANLLHYYEYPAATQWSLDGSAGHSLSLQNLIDFAKAQGKPIAIAEAGAGGTADGAGVSDNPTFVQWLYTTLENSGVPVKFVNLWDSNAGSNYEFSMPGDNKPLEAAAWAKYFGGAGGITTQPASVTVGSGASTIDLKMSEDAWDGNAQFIVSVDGVAQGGSLTALATHATGQDQDFLLLGNWGTGTHQVTIDFLNDAWGGSSAQDRNLYLDAASFNGTVTSGATLALPTDGTRAMDVGTGALPTISIGSGADMLVLKVSEDFWNGNALFTVRVDGVQVGGTLTALASHAAGQDQSVLVEGNWGAGSHTVAVSFLNDAWGGSAAQDRNLYVDGATYDGAVQAAGTLGLHGTGTQSFTATSSTTTNTGSLATSLVTQGNDIVNLGSGAVTIQAAGPSVQVAGSSGSLLFIAGPGAASITAGTGAETYQITKGHAGGALTIADFVGGRDVISLQGFTGSGINTESVSGGSTQFLLTDGTKITLQAYTGTNQSIF